MQQSRMHAHCPRAIAILQLLLHSTQLVVLLRNQNISPPQKECKTTREAASRKVCAVVGVVKSSDGSSPLLCRVHLFLHFVPTYNQQLTTRDGLDLAGAPDSWRIERTLRTSIRCIRGRERGEQDTDHKQPLHRPRMNESVPSPLRANDPDNSHQAREHIPSCSLANAKKE